MRASFQGQNIFALGNGIAVLNSAWTESGQASGADKEKHNLKRDAAELAKSVLNTGSSDP